MKVKVDLKVEADPDKTACVLTIDSRQATIIFHNDEQKTVELETAQSPAS